MSVDRQQIIGRKGRKSEIKVDPLNRSLLFAICKFYCLFVNFDNTWTKPECLESSNIYKEMRQNHHLGQWLSLMLLYIDYSDLENWRIRALEIREGYKEGLIERISLRKRKGIWKENPVWLKDPGSEQDLRGEGDVWRSALEDTWRLWPITL